MTYRIVPKTSASRSFALLFVLLTAHCALPTAHSKAEGLRFERVVIDADMPGGYQVEVADVNGDHLPDVVALGGGTCVWYENPAWTKRVVTTPARTPGIISSATADLDGDGKAEIAIAYEFAMDQPKQGRLLLALQEAEGRWGLRPIASVGSIHRLRWGDVDGDGRLDLVVAPIFGPDAKPPSYDQDPARLLVFRTGADPKSGLWDSQVVARRPVMHAIEVAPQSAAGRVEILTADNLGVARVRLAPGAKAWEETAFVQGARGTAPKRGSSEVHHGRLAGKIPFTVTIDPWHGSEVAVYTGAPARDLVPRVVIDTTLADGHALWVADVDGDGDDEIFAGHRGRDHRVSFYDFDGKAWQRTVIDRAVAAQDLRGGDLDGDGTPDVVAIGGTTHNVVWYRPKKDR